MRYGAGRWRGQPAFASADSYKHPKCHPYLVHYITKLCLKPRSLTHHSEGDRRVIENKERAQEGRRGKGLGDGMVDYSVTRL